MNNVKHYPKISKLLSTVESTVAQPEIVLMRTDDFRPSKLTVRLMVCLLESQFPVLLPVHTRRLILPVLPVDPHSAGENTSGIILLHFRFDQSYLW